MPLRRETAVAGFLPFVAASSSQAPACEVVKVSGGVAPGSYTLSAVLQSAGGGGDVYAQAGPDGETAAVLLFTEGSVRRGRRRRRRLEHEDQQQKQQQHQHQHQHQYQHHHHQHQQQQGDGGAVSAGPGDWGQAAQQHQQEGWRGRSLAQCPSGFWINQSGDGAGSTTTASAAASSPDLDSLVYPVYAVSDCADHPADISADWFSVGCSACELELEPALVIECDDEYDADDVGDGQPTPPPSLGSGAAPGSGTGFSSSSLTSGSAATTGTRSPVTSTTSSEIAVPGVVPDEAATPVPSSGAPEPAATLLPTAALMNPAPVDLPPSEQPETPSPSDVEFVDSSSSSSSSDASPESNNGDSVEGDGAGTSNAVLSAAGGSAGACAAALFCVVLAVVGFK